MKKHIFFALIILFFFTFVKDGQAINTVEMLMVKGSEAYDKGDYKTAISFFEKAIQINPKYVPAYNLAALAHKSDGASVDLVENILKRAIDVDPNYAPPYDNLGKIYYGLGRFDEARDYSLKALDRDPSLISARQSLAWTYLVGKEEPLKAIEAFEQVVQKEEIPFAYLGLGIAYIMNNQKILALETITKLRNLGQDKLAQELERMVRQDDYRPAIKALYPFKEAQKTVTIEEHKYDAVSEMPVRLKHDNPSRVQEGVNREASSGRISASERLRQLRLQENSGANPSY